MTERMAERDDPFRNGGAAEEPSPPSPVLPAEWERPIWSPPPDMAWADDRTVSETPGDELMTGAQASYLKTLCDEAKEPFDDSLTRAEASKRIEALQKKARPGDDR